MKKLILLSLILCRLNSFSQKVYLENFNTIQSLKNWKISTNGVVEHNNHFTFNGETFYKSTKDSFLILYDTTNNKIYNFKISRTYKAIPSHDLKFRVSFFSNDTMKDYLLYSCRIFDKSGETLFSFPFYLYYNFYPIGIIGFNINLPEKNDTIWKTADSMTISFQFRPENSNKKLERLTVIDEIYLDGVYASINTLRKDGFEIYPNPTSKFIYFKFDTKIKPRQIQLYDYTGKLVTASKGEERINVENLDPGLYFVTIKFENGTIATKKIEIN